MLSNTVSEAIKSPNEYSAKIGIKFKIGELIVRGMLRIKNCSGLKICG